ncbi:MAG: cell surface protein SprA [bacterium]|nr:cell surface protein SprA [bacterium]
MKITTNKSALYILVLLLLFNANTLVASDLLLPGLDPILKTTDDPRLLGPDRIVQQNRLKALGVDLPAQDCRPTLLTIIRSYMHDKFHLDLVREISFTEISSTLGIATTFRHPEFFFLEQSLYELPGGFVYTPARDIDNRNVDLFVDDIDLVSDRNNRVTNITNISKMLDIRGGTSSSQSSQGINLTIPIKLPKTLEKIIGRGDKTNIRISGREHISISGESSVSNRFTPNERRQNPSLFPTLDMEQQLQISMSGQIGEKIHLEVDHNSEAIGPDGTKIRLTYEGSEDEIIQSIETGDVGLTLPGSQLLGYSSNKSGLFGVKVTGQVGRADFTVVASKQKAESASKSFNSQGGSVSDHIIEAYRYLNNRFFRLDLPPNDFVLHAQPDSPGRDRLNEFIDLSSLRVFRFVGAGRQQDGDVRYVVGVTDESGRWDENGYIANQLLDPSTYILGELWRPVEAEILQDQNGNLVAIDLLHEYSYHDVLVATYSVLNAAGDLLYKVGDVAGEDEDNQWDGGDGQVYYRMKLLKPQNPEPFTWQYVLRNIYPLGGSNIDPESFDCRVEINMPTDFPDIDLDLQGNGSGLQWLRIFGLDRKNLQGEDGADGLVDKNDPYLFDLQKGLLKFPLDFAHPFDGDPAYYTLFADSSAFNFEESLLASNLIPEIYDPATTESQMASYTQFRIISSHAAASSSFNLGVSNLEEDSETVILDGRTLVRDVDYTIDYMFGQITLKGEAASSMGADSQISVDYQYAPFMGGGNSTLLGLNMGYDLGRDNRFSTTWLYESTQVVGHKAKLGEEPSRNLVGNVNGQLTIRPHFLTTAANILSRHNSDRESSVQISGEFALSVPNPNTFNEVYVEDFEGIDSSDIMPTSRLSWSKASIPSHGLDMSWTGETGDERIYSTGGRVDTRWYLPKSNTLRRYLNPLLKEQEGKETQQVLHMYMDSGEDEWGPLHWGGLLRGLGRSGVDLTKTQFIEFWVNDYQLNSENRTGTVHIDFGYINEDFYWPENEFSSVDTMTYQKEDDGDGVFTIDEDVGLGDNAVLDKFSADYVNDNDPYPWINGTRGNNREDSEDLDGDTVFDRQDGFYTISVAMSDSAMVDVVRDYDHSLIGTNLDNDLAWRKYRIRLGDALPVSPPGGTTASLATVTHIRVWFEDDDAAPGTHRRDLQISELKFLGSRWEREGVRKVATNENPEEQLLTGAEIGANEGFFIGEVNNKENPDYIPPFELYVEHNIPEKEQSMVLDYQNLEQQHLVRASRVMSPIGDDYTQYERLTWYLFNPDQSQSEMDLFFRLGADTLNYYEVSYRFDESSGPRTGWKELRVDVAELSNTKLDPRDPVSGWIETTINDPETNDEYRVRVVGAPDLRHVKRYYIGTANLEHEMPQSGYFYFNDVRLRKVKREVGIAERLGVRLNMADVIKVDLDWSKRDSDFHGLNAEVGQGFTNENLNLSTNFKVNDFIPMLGFQLPITLGRQETTRRPKYLTNSDIEIIDEDLRISQSTLENRENFSIRLRRNPSRLAITRYMLDPWNLSLSGSRASSTAPLSHGWSSGLQGSISYDLRISGNHTLAALGPVRHVPLVRSIGLLPSKISLSGNFNNTERKTENLSPISGEFVLQPVNLTKRGTLTGNFDYKPLPISELSLTLRSERDMFREQKVMGVNIGKENQFNQSVQLKFQPPTKLGLPDKWFTRPIRDGFRALQSIKPSVTFNGSFRDNHGPNIRQTGDPEGIRTAGASGDWNIRATVPLNSLVDTWFPVNTGMSDADRKAKIEREKKLNKRRNRRRSSGRDVPEAVGQQDIQQGAVLSDEERRIQEEEALLQAALDREAAEEEGRTATDPDEDQVDDEQEVIEESDGGRKINIPNPLNPLLYVLRKSNPVQISYSIKDESNYSRMLGETPFWYKVGIWDELDLPDSLYATSSLSDRSTISLSTNTKLGRWVTMDFKFNSMESGRSVGGNETRSTQKDWPDVRLSIGGVEKLRIFGGHDNDGIFRSSTIDMSFKKSTTVNGYTETVYNPKHTTVINPRWNMTFSNGMTTSLNVNYSSDNMEQNGTLSKGNRLNFSTQWRHSFSAERLLSKIGLYRPGVPPTVSMDLDLSFSRDATDRWMPGSNREGESDTQTGNTRMSINPRLSYQISRNLSGALRFLFSRDKIHESDTITTSLGIGVESTYVF